MSSLNKPEIHQYSKWVEFDFCVLNGNPPRFKNEYSTQLELNQSSSLVEEMIDQYVFSWGSRGYTGTGNI